MPQRVSTQSCQAPHNPKVAGSNPTPATIETAGQRPRVGKYDPPAMAVTRGFNHVATLTTDCDRHAEFYGRAFGAEVTFRMEADGAHPRMFILDLGGGAALNVFEVEEQDILGERRQQGGRGAIDHFAIAVETRGELEVVKERIVDAGGEVGEIQRLGEDWSLFFRDIDGMELEVVAPDAEGDG